MQTVISPPVRTSYRADIDGLRALAVVIVVCNHLHLCFSGGFIGVDVFFVISGYLISSIIMSEIASGRFSIVQFYERRVRRILPALFVLLVACSIGAYRYFIPSETVSYARSMIAATFSYSNVFFWNQTGYFDLPSSFKPLLHTWSLAVEEQFYIFFPLALMLVRRWSSRHLQTLIWGAAAFSFLSACFMVGRDSGLAFYWAPFRAWELLIGTILSQRYLPRILKASTREASTLSGLAMILLPACFYTSRTPFPGLAATLPCLGAALIIAGGETGPSWIGRLLACKPVVFIGLISYSLYLWHWPILVFQNTNSFLISGHAGGRAPKYAVLLASLVAGTLSWRFVETPFRKGSMRLGRVALFSTAATAFSLLVGIAAYGIGSKGIPGRFPPSALQVALYNDFDTTEAFRVNSCFLQTKSDITMFRKDVCLKEDGEHKQYLLLGDSHAAALYSGLATVLPDINLSQATVASCKPFLSPDTPDKGCKQMMEFLYGSYLLNHHPDKILLTGRWDERDLPQLGQLLAWLRQHHQNVVLIGPVMEYDSSLPRILATSIRERDPGLISQHYMPQLSVLDKKLARSAKEVWKLPYISMFDDLCKTSLKATLSSGPKAGVCPVYAGDGVPMLIDSDHLSPLGSLLFAQQMVTEKQIP